MPCRRLYLLALSTSLILIGSAASAQWNWYQPLAGQAPHDYTLYGRWTPSPTWSFSMPSYTYSPPPRPSHGYSYPSPLRLSGYLPLPNGMSYPYSSRLGDYDWDRQRRRRAADSLDSFTRALRVWGWDDPSTQRKFRETMRDLKDALRH